MPNLRAKDGSGNVVLVEQHPFDPDVAGAAGPVGTAPAPSFKCVAEIDGVKTTLSPGDYVTTDKVTGRKKVITKAVFESTHTKID